MITTVWSYSKFVRTGCALTYGHPFPHHRVCVIIKPELSPPRRFPFDVKRGFVRIYFYYTVTVATKVKCKTKYILLIKELQHLVAQDFLLVVV